MSGQPGSPESQGGCQRVASTLAGIRERLNGSWTNAAVRQVWVDDAPRLLKAAEAVLKLADDWSQLSALRAQDECAGELREAITAELTKEAGE